MRFELDSKKGADMKDWIFPSGAFIVFLYAMVFLIAHLHNYTSADMSLFDGANVEYRYGEIGEFLKDISKSFNR